VILDRRLQFVVELTKELNKILEINTKSSTSFYLQTNGQMKRMNQELKQYLQFFINYRRKDWLEWLVTAKFTVNNKTYSAIKMSPFIANYGR